MWSCDAAAALEQQRGRHHHGDADPHARHPRRRPGLRGARSVDDRRARPSPAPAGRHAADGRAIRWTPGASTPSPPTSPTGRWSPTTRAASAAASARTAVTDRTPEMHAADLHALITALGTGPVDLFASSGGAVNALALVAAHPDDVGTLVAHEPPLLGSSRTPTTRSRLSEAADGLPRQRFRRRHGRLHRPDLVAGRVHRRLPRPARPRPGASSACPPTTTAAATTRCCPAPPTRSRATAPTSRPRAAPDPRGHRRSASSPRNCSPGGVAPAARRGRWAGR